LATPPAIEAITNSANAGTDVPEELTSGKGDPTRPNGLCAFLSEKVEPTKCLNTRIGISFHQREQEKEEEMVVVI
jgi:hypothetical protein